MSDTVEVKFDIKGKIPKGYKGWTPEIRQHVASRFADLASEMMEKGERKIHIVADLT